MIKCNNCVPIPCCDFCAYYDFNGDEDGVYIDKGWCNKFTKSSLPEYGQECNEFICNQSQEGMTLKTKRSKIMCNKV